MADNKFFICYYLLEVADFSHGIEFIFKAVKAGQCNLRTIFPHSHWKKNNVRIFKEREKEWIKFLV